MRESVDQPSVHSEPLHTTLCSGSIAFISREKKVQFYALFDGKQQKHQTWTLKHSRWVPFGPASVCPLLHVCVFHFSNKSHKSKEGSMRRTLGWKMTETANWNIETLQLMKFCLSMCCHLLLLHENFHAFANFEVKNKLKCPHKDTNFVCGWKQMTLLHKTLSRKSFWNFDGQCQWT